MIKILQGDVIVRLRELPADSVHCCVTSPPYWGLRDYGTGRWEGGQSDCDHKQVHGSQGKTGQRANRSHPGEIPFKDTCGKCGAVRVDQQIGLEPTPESYIVRLVEVFREVRRVLRPDGTLWVNIGDSYNAHPGQRKTTDAAGPKQRTRQVGALKPKDLVMIPARLALALQADGWWLRSDIIWHKPNPMPESVTDRPTKSHEYIFLLSKSADYFYDYVAIQEPASSDTHARYARGRSNTHKWADGGPGNQSIAKSFDHMLQPGVHPKAAEPNSRIKSNSSFSATVKDIVTARNKRSVWEIATQPFPEAHFATYPEELAGTCVKAGTSEHGCCAACGAPWERVVEHTPMEISSGPKSGGYGSRTTDGLSGTMISPALTKTTGWEPVCECGGDPVPCTVLDPFSGSGTTGLVCAKAGLNYIGVELKPDYAEMSRRRIDSYAPLFQIKSEVA